MFQVRTAFHMKAINSRIVERLLYPHNVYPPTVTPVCRGMALNIPCMGQMPFRVLNAIGVIGFIPTRIVVQVGGYRLRLDTILETILVSLRIAFGPCAFDTGNQPCDCTVAHFDRPAQSCIEGYADLPYWEF